MTTIATEPEMLLWLSDARGRFIPRDFATSFADRATAVAGVNEDEWKVLEAGPDSEDYWDVWTSVCDNAVITLGEIKYFIWQEGDCWLVPEGMTWDEDTETFTW